MLDIIRDWLLTFAGLPEEWASPLARSIAFGVLLILSLAANFVARRLLVTWLRRWTDRTRTSWDDQLMTRGVFNRISHLAPAAVVHLLSPVVFEGYPDLIVLVGGGTLLYMLVVGLLVIDAILNASLDFYQTLRISREVPLKSFIQVIKIGLYFLGLILSLSIILGKSPTGLLTGLGAMTAVLMLVFKDAILGLVAGIQLTTNRMVARGDWIEMPKYEADGEVLEVALTTVKVRNWDNTITTIPTYALISDSFRNWRGMQQSGGRRIKRAVYLDQNTVRFCDDEMLKRLEGIELLREYLARKREELARFNADRKTDPVSLVNGRRLTNLGTFRAYVVAYLRDHAQINQELTFLVRLLAPSAEGIPLEIYVFCSDKRWVEYEGIQSDLFDHILASVPEFGLRVFQRPGGGDIQALSGSLARIA